MDHPLLSDKSIMSYESTADEYEEMTRGLTGVRTSIENTFLGMISPRGTILDFACGPGWDAEYFAQQGYKVVGIDGSPAMVAKAAMRVPAGNFFVHDMRESLRDLRVDAALCRAGLLCLKKKDVPNALRTLYDAITHDGPLFTTIKEGNSEGWEFDNRYSVDKYFSYYTRDEFIGLLDAAGFDVKCFEIQDISGSYQTHPWIRVLATRR